MLLLGLCAMFSTASSVFVGLRPPAGVAAVNRRWQSVVVPPVQLASALASALKVGSASVSTPLGGFAMTKLTLSAATSARLNAVARALLTPGEAPVTAVPCRNWASA